MKTMASTKVDLTMSVKVSFARVLKRNARHATVFLIMFVSLIVLSIYLSNRYAVATSIIGVLFGWSLMAFQVSKIMNKDLMY